jgi:hypothetical protein
MPYDLDDLARGGLGQPMTDNAWRDDVPQFAVIDPAIRRLGEKLREFHGAEIFTTTSSPLRRRGHPTVTSPLMGRGWVRGGLLSSVVHFDFRLAIVLCALCAATIFLWFFSSFTISSITCGTSSFKSVDIIVSLFAMR